MSAQEPMRGFAHVPAKPGVYCIRLVTDKRMYIGSSKNMRKRIQNHLSALRTGKHHSDHLQRAYAKYGLGKFEVFVIGYYGQSQLMEKEQQWLDTFPCQFNGSRIAYRVEHTPETIKKMSDKCKAAWQRPSHRKHMAEVMRPPPPPNPDTFRTAEHRAKLRTVHRTRLAKHEAFGRVWSLKDLAETYGVKYGMLCERIRAGWDAERAVTTPKRKGGL